MNSRKNDEVIKDSEERRKRRSTTIQQFRLSKKLPWFFILCGSFFVFDGALS